MDKNTTATFIGHAECFGLDQDRLKQEIIHLIEQGVTTFLSGGMGEFDWACAHMIHRLRKEYPKIRSYLVIPYLSQIILNREYFDEILYPEGFEKYHFKAAIPKRNQYLVEHSDYAICYVKHTYGGAAQTLRKAEKQGLTIVNLAD